MDNTVVLQRHPANAMNKDFIYMTLPPFAIATYLYGVRVLLLMAVAVLTANLCDRLVAAMRKLPYDRTENSSIAFSLIMLMMMPASVPYYVVALSVAIAALIAKAAFGGYGVYPFAPACVGFSVAAISWPDKLFNYPQPLTRLPLTTLEGVVLTSGPSHALKAGGLPTIDTLNLILGNYASNIGATSVLVILACAAYLWMRKRITLAAPIGFLLACIFVAYFFPRLGGIGIAWPWQFVRYRGLTVMYELLSGAILFAAIFLLCDPVTLPKREDARFFYGILAGITTMLFRYYGSFEMGACFALILANVFSAPIDRWAYRISENKQRKKSIKKQKTTQSLKEGEQ